MLCPVKLSLLEILCGTVMYTYGDIWLLLVLIKWHRYLWFDSLGAPVEVPGSSGGKESTFNTGELS